LRKELRQEFGVSKLVNEVVYVPYFKSVLSLEEALDHLGGHFLEKLILLRKKVIAQNQALRSAVICCTLGHFLSLL